MSQLAVATARLAALSLCVASLAAQQLVADLNRQAPGIPPSSSPAGFLTLPTQAVFRATTASSGTEPWISDGTLAGTRQIADLVPGSAGSNPVILGAYQGEIVLAATLPGAGLSVFLSDGTPAGTRAVGDLGLPREGTTITMTVLPNGRALLVTASGAILTDFTPAGTDVLPGLARFEAGVALGNLLVGTIATTVQGVTRTDLWVCDGTAAGTRLLQADFSTARPTNFVAYQGRAYALERLASGMVVLASSDGTGPAVRHVDMGNFPLGQVGMLQQVGGRFVALRLLAMPIGAQMVASDLTQAGTGVLNLPCQDIGDLVEHGGALYFRGTTAASGYELWRTDGTVAGTSQVADLRPGAAGSHPERLRSTPQGLFFRGVVGGAPVDRRLYRLTGTATIQELGAIPNDALGVADYAVLPGGVLFAASDSAGRELWYADFQQAPLRLADINRAAPGILTSAAVPSVAVRDRLYFVAASDGIRYALWSTDGTATGTVQASPFRFPFQAMQPLAHYRDRLAYAAETRVAITSGSTASEVVLLDSIAGSTATKIKVAGPVLYFLTSAGQLHRSDGSAGNATRVPGVQLSSQLSDFEVLDRYLVVQSGADSFWSLDGVNTQQLLVVGPGSLLGKFGNLAVIRAASGLYATDGTVAGTVVLTNQNFVIGSSFAAVGPQQAYAVDSQRMVWQTDGTAANTTAIAALPSDLVVRQMIATEQQLYLVAETVAEGRELWRLDRATNQFRIVVDLAPGIRSGVVTAAAVGIGDRLLVTGGDASTGVELYVSDGTAAGTQLLVDVASGPESSNPRFVGVADRTVYFTADDGVHGNELWRLPLAAVGAAHRQDYGVGSLGSVGEPRLQQPLVPRPGNAQHRLTVDRVPALAPMVLGVATELADLPFGVARLQLGGLIASQFGFANAGGVANFALPIPASPAFVGQRLLAQSFALDALAPGGYAASPGLLFVVGR